MREVKAQPIFESSCNLFLLTSFLTSGWIDLSGEDQMPVISFVLENFNRTCQMFEVATRKER
jgi:hypothetical protein